jgi:hypothetical protein
MRKILFTATILRDHVGIVAHYHTPTRHGSVRADTTPEALERLKQLAAELDAEAHPRQDPTNPPDTSHGYLSMHHRVLAIAYLEAETHGNRFRFYDGSVPRYYSVNEREVARLGRMLEKAKADGHPESEAYLLWRESIGRHTLTFAP